MQGYNSVTDISKLLKLLNWFPNSTLGIGRLLPAEVVAMKALSFNKMDHELSGQDLILQRSSSLMEDSFSLYSTFTLQDRVVAIEQSGEEFYEKVSKKKTLKTEWCVGRGLIVWHRHVLNVLISFLVFIDTFSNNINWWKYCNQNAKCTL